MKLSKKILFLNLFLVFIVSVIIIIFIQKQYNQKSYSAKGEITSTVNKMIAACGKRSYETLDCYNKQFTSLTKSKSTAFSLDVLTELGKKDGKINLCHAIAHMIADAEIAKDYTKWRSFLISLENPVICTRGLIHGTIEALLRYDPSFQFEPKYISTLCQSLRTSIKGSAGDHDCSHGVGHILLVRYENDISRAVAFCNELQDDLIYRCLDGVFMESVLRDMLILHGVAKPLPFTTQGILIQEHICQQQVGLAAKACWKEISLLYVFSEPFDQSRSWNVCQRAIGLENKKECYLHSVFLAFTERVAPQKSYNVLCSPFFTDDVLYKECLFRLFYNSNFQSSTVKDDAIKFCSVQPKDKKSLCCTMIEERIEKSITHKTAVEVRAQCIKAIK